MTKKEKFESLNYLLGSCLEIIQSGASLDEVDYDVLNSVLKKTTIFLWEYYKALHRV